MHCCIWRLCNLHNSDLPIHTARCSLCVSHIFRQGKVCTTFCPLDLGKFRASKLSHRCISLPLWVCNGHLPSSLRCCQPGLLGICCIGERTPMPSPGSMFPLDTFRTAQYARERLRCCMCLHYKLVFLAHHDSKTHEGIRGIRKSSIFSGTAWSQKND